MNWNPASRLMVLVCLLSGAFVSSGTSAESQPAAIRIAGVENAFQVTKGIYSGGQPMGDEAFAALQKLGVRTLISVDGTKPDVERAAKFGLRYVHLPHGYDGIPEQTALSLIKAAQTVEGPLFLHCHHGIHRGPAAVGLICQATAGWSTHQAMQWLKAAGTAPDYAGLFQVNMAFRLPDAEALRRTSTNFPAQAKVSGLVDAMVEVDRRWDNLKAIQEAGWRVPANQPDLRLAAEGLLLQEAFRELGKSAEAKAKGSEFLERLRQAEATAEKLHALLKANPSPLSPSLASRADELAKAAKQDCAACHKQFRN